MRRAAAAHAYHTVPHYKHAMAVSVRFCRLDELQRSPVGNIRQCLKRVPREFLPEARQAWDRHAKSLPPSGPDRRRAR
jgi:hypothetical protein